MKKCYIVLNVLSGWKVVLDGKHVDCTKPLATFEKGQKGLEQAKNFCNENNLKVVRVCQ